MTGDAAVQHDIAPALARALRVGELYLAVPAALVILLLVFGTGSALLPFVFAAPRSRRRSASPGRVAHVLELSDYLLNMVMMIGLGIAIDYSLLVVNRYRDERRGTAARTRRPCDETMRPRRPDDRLQRPRRLARARADAAAARCRSCAASASAACSIPVVSVVCALTLLPVMLLDASASGSSACGFLPRRLAERRHASRAPPLDARTRAG